MVEFQASAPSWLGRQERCLWAEKLSSNQPEKSCFLCLGLWVALPLECWPQLPVPSLRSALVLQSCLDFFGARTARQLRLGWTPEGVRQRLPAQRQGGASVPPVA